MPAPHLTLERLAKRYGDNPPAVDGLDLAVSEGEFVALLGPSGCGKTTTLRMIAGLVPVTAGTIRVAGRDITRLPAHARAMGLVFQSYALFPHMSVARNVAFGLEMRGTAGAERQRRVEEALATVRLEALGHRRPRELSGGQQQRVALARALVIEPSILLLDEPLSNLDAKLREEMRGEIRDIQRRFGMTTIFVTHDQVEALAMCDRIAVMNNGRIEQIGAPRDIHEQPATPFVAGFVGRINRFVCPLDQGTLRLGPHRLATATPPAAAERAEVMVRPHRIGLAAAGAAGTGGTGENRVEGRVVRATYLGEVTQYEVEVGDVRLAVERPSERGQPAFALGDAVTLAWSAADTLVFPVSP